MIDIERAIELYCDEGRTLADAASILGCSETGLSRALKRRGFQIRRPNGAYSGSSGNRAYFKTWSPSMAYVLGYTVADGCVRSHKYSVSYKSIDQEVLEFVKSQTGSSSQVKPARRGKIYEFALYGKEFTQDLCQMGVTDRKSLTVKLPDIPDAYFFDFLRGLIDGDGHIRKFAAVCICGSTYLIPTLVQKLSAKLGLLPPKPQKAGKALQISYYGDQAIAILEKCYTPDAFAINRKKASALKILYERDRPRSCVKCGDEIVNRNPSKTTVQRRYCDGCKLERIRELNRVSYRKRMVNERGQHGTTETGG